MSSVPVSRNVSLQGHVAIVSGGARGIGGAVAVALAAAGASVAVFDSLAADDTVAAATAKGAQCRSWRLDVSDEEAVNRAVAEVAASLGSGWAAMRFYDAASIGALNRG